ncbi:hypothetical protein EFM17_08900, partial [Lactobacillus delbrueckii]|nr:hypothetical protein [Lactobacillus delbrueckii]
QGPQGPKGDTGATGLQGLQGPKGDQGIQGRTGPQGLPSYTHIAYANSSDGTIGFDVSNGAGKTYIGIYCDSEASDSTDSTRYTWSLIKGERGDQGIPGTKGADGQTPYLHIAYANSSDGTIGFDASNSDGKLYIGQYTDYTQADSTNPASYKWARIKGDTGQTGATGAQGPQGEAGADVYYSIYEMSPNQQGMYLTDLTPAVSQTNLPKIGSHVIAPSGKVYEVTATYPNANPPQYGVGPQLTSIAGPVGPKGDAGDQGIPGPKGDNGQTTYVHFAYANSADGSTNFNVSYFSNALYVGTYTDYTPTDSGDYTKYIWSRLKGDTGTSFKLFTTNYTYSQNEIDSYSGTGYSGTWSVNESTSELRVGDTVQLRCTNSSKAGYSFIIAKVTAIPGDKLITCVSSGLIDKGDTGPTGATGAKGDTGSTGFFIGTTPPPNPAVGTVWATADSSGNMNSAKTWNGSAWVSTAFTQDLVAGNITATKIVGGELDIDKVTIKNAQNIPITSTVSLGQKLSDIKHDADGLNATVLGGGNLLNDTSDALQNLSGTDWTYYVTSQDEPVAKHQIDGKTVTLSAWIENPSKDAWVQMYTDKGRALGNTIPAGGRGWSQVTYTMPSGFTGWNIVVGCGDNSGAITLSYSSLQLEIGPNRTAWSQSTADISSLKITANSLNAYIKKSEGSNILSSILSMDPNNSMMAQLVNNKVVAAINLSKEGDVQIDGSHISLNSATTIPDATIKSAMIDSVDASKIKAGVLDASLIRVINLDANSITTKSLSAVLNETDVFQPFIVSSSNVWDFNDTKSANGNWFLVGETTADHVHNGPGYNQNKSNPLTPYMFVTSRGSAANNQFTVTVWKDNDPTRYQRIWNHDHWTDWVMLPNSQNLVSAINLSPDGVTIEGKNIELNGDTTITGQLNLLPKDQQTVSQFNQGLYNPWAWRDSKVFAGTGGIQLQSTITGQKYSDGTSVGGLVNNSSAAITTLAPTYLKFTLYPTWNDFNNNFSNQLCRTYIDAGRIESSDIRTDNFSITGNNI